MIRHLLIPAVVLLGASSSAAAALIVDLSTNAVSASGVTPGGRAVLFAVARHAGGDEFSLRHYARMQRASASGEVRFEIPEGVPRASVWIVVDAERGLAGARAPSNSSFRPFTTALTEIVAPNDGRLERVQMNRTNLYLLWVRRGVGVWRFTGSDGTPADGDAAADGRVTAIAARMEPLFGAPTAPPSFLIDDSFIVIDTQRGEYAIVGMVR